ncbi:ImmA/IrrE family metallo-endopeptidase [Marilutibacter maris]|nr:ImmA/IrrE family metallo-endopeptidase [Lysobacter maris]
MSRLAHSDLLRTPVDVYSVAEFLGLEVQEEVMDDELSGYIEPRKSGWVIGVNSYHHPNRQRFTVAHEIAHFLLHKPKERHLDVTFARRSGGRNKMEAEADSFAANLLMPESEVRDLISGGETSLDRIAGRFGVSVMAAKYRAQSLGYKVR